MKRLIVFIALAVLLGFSADLLAAQTAAATPAPENLYIKTLYINKIYPHNLGYKILYWTHDGKIATTYVPLSWFNGTAGKGELLYQINRSVPYMDVIFSSGKFKLIRLHLNPSYADFSWGALPGNEDPSDKFKIDSPDLVY